MTGSAIHPGAPARHYALLDLGDLRLLIPQPEIRALEPTLDVEPAPDPGGSAAGWIPFEGERWPVYCLSRQLEPLARIPDSRRVCVLVGAGEHRFGLACDSVAPVAGTDVQSAPLPVCMASGYGAIDRLGLYQGGVVLIVGAAMLAGYLEHRYGLATVTPQPEPEQTRLPGRTAVHRTMPLERAQLRGGLTPGSR